MQRYLLSAATATSALAASLFLSACGGSGEHGSTPTLDVRSTLAFGACAVPIADPVAVCGTLTVPEDRLDNTSRLIGLPFVVLPATTHKPAKEPTVVFTGGPGPSPLRTLADLTAEALLQNPLRQTRDVIVMTQRGTDLTLPQSLDCNELVLDFAAGERFASEDAVVAAATACRNRLVVAGAKLSAYTTKAIAHDMEALRLLLGQRRGFKQWNVVGSSYGSKLALAYMRDAPAGVRSAVLDGPAPLQNRDLYDAGVLDALSNIVNACNANAVCAAAYPGLQARFAAAVERLQNAPATVRGTAVRGVDILNALRAALSVPQAPYGKLPMFMDFVARGDVASADTLLPFVDNVLLAINPEGMFYTVTCTDDAGLSNQANNALPPLGAGWPDAVRRLIARNGLGLQARTCPLWTQGQTLSTDVLKPLRSDIRTLITVGQFDAATPAVGADTLLVDLPRAHKAVFTGRGHGLLESDVCALQVVAAFIDDPRQPPDASCIDPAGSLQFLTPAPVVAEPLALQQGIEEFLLAQPLIPSVMARLESPAGAQAWSGSSGVVAGTGNAPARPEAAFRIASVTKAFTAAATHRLVELSHVGLRHATTLHLLPTTVATLRAQQTRNSQCEYRCG